MYLSPEEATSSANTASVLSECLGSRKEESNLGTILSPYVKLWMSFLCLEAQFFTLCGDFGEVLLNHNGMKSVF